MKKCVLVFLVVVFLMFNSLAWAEEMGKAGIPVIASAAIQQYTVLPKDRGATLLEFQLAAEQKFQVTTLTFLIESGASNVDAVMLLKKRGTDWEQVSNWESVPAGCLSETAIPVDLWLKGGKFRLIGNISTVAEVGTFRVQLQEVVAKKAQVFFKRPPLQSVVSIVSTGNLKVSWADNTAQSTIVWPDYLLGLYSFKFQAEVDDLLVRKLRFVSSGALPVGRVSIEFGGVPYEGSSYFDGENTIAEVEFSGEVRINQGTEVEAVLDVGLPEGFSGTRIRFFIDKSGWEIFSTTSGEVLSSEAINISACVDPAEFVLYNTIFPVRALPFTGTESVLMAGSNRKICQWRISTTFTGEGIDLKRITFRVSKSVATILSNFSLWRDGVQIPNDHLGISQPEGTDESYTFHLLFQPPYSEVVLPGRVVKYELKATISGQMSVGDYCSVSLLGDEEYIPMGIAHEIWPTNNFAWSDISDSNHSEFSSDWANGFLVPGLPSEACVLYK